MKNVIKIVVIIFISIIVYQKCIPKKISRNYFLTKPFINFNYRDSIPTPEFKNLDMLGTVHRTGIDTKEGKIIYAIQYENITDAVEKRYHLPHHLMLAIIITESCGVNWLPNSTDDGGFGLCHMQPATAHWFGLRIFQNCDSIVCHHHAKKLWNTVRYHKNDIQYLSHLDERLNPLVNIDCAARIISYYRYGKSLSGMDPLETALFKYSNRSNYCDNITSIINELDNQGYMNGIEEKFNEQNKNLTINGEPADFDEFIETSQEQNYNLGLGEYKMMKIESPKKPVF